jgi:hypothetical protein
MRYEGTYKIKSVSRTENGETFEAVQLVRSGTGKYYKLQEITVPEDVDLEPGDVVRLMIENHSAESGSSSRSWAIERFIGFPYDKDRGWNYSEGI